MEEMDRQHRTLVDMINRVYELMEKGDLQQAKTYFKKEITLYLERGTSPMRRGS
ncbi:MAG: hypothetical protein Q9N34_10655 [Aquificota bacterium]|nr:hypothetical protein [Aquificota bacterium]